VGEVAEARKVGAVTYREADQEEASFRFTVSIAILVVFLGGERQAPRSRQLHRRGEVEVRNRADEEATRHRGLPEEEFALTRGEHGHPETEGYGRTQLEDYGAAFASTNLPRWETGT